MYLQLSEKSTVRTNEIVGIFDLDGTSISKKTRDFLASEQKNNRVLGECKDLPRSFLLMEKGIRLTPISTNTLKRRLTEEIE